MRRAAGLASALLAASLLACSCGIPTSTAPRLMSRSALPAALVQQAPRNSGHGGGSGNFAEIRIYLVQIVSGELVCVTRPVKRPVTVQSVLDELEAGPVPSDYENGDGSALATESHLTFLGMAKKTATIRLDSYFVSLEGEAPVEEVAQIVWTVIEDDPGVRRIRFLGPSGPIAVETYKTGRFVHRAVGESDYELGIAGTGCGS